MTPADPAPLSLADAAYWRDSRKDPARPTASRLPVIAAAAGQELGMSVLPGHRRAAPARRRRPGRNPGPGRHPRPRPDRERHPRPLRTARSARIAVGAAVCRARDTRRSGARWRAWPARSTPCSTACRRKAHDPAFRFKVHSQHVRLHMSIAEHARSPLLTQAIERNHVLILNWLFDVGARRTPLPADFHRAWSRRWCPAIRMRPTGHARPRPLRAGRDHRATSARWRPPNGASAPGRSDRYPARRPARKPR